jgi:MoaA/NifB/PqqE/SkfB family radical SAM enzyme
MLNFIRSIGKSDPAKQTIQPGLYHYQAPQNDPRNYRLHLRVEPDGNGVLIVNAATVLHLNQSATEFAYYFLQNQPADLVAHAMARRYRVSQQQAFEDYLDFADRILTLVEMPDLDPVTFLDFERRLPHTGRLTAPYRLDIALTYRLPEDADPQSAPTKRVERELTTAEWKTVLDNAWKMGIPHVVFTGGEPTLRDDLPELITCAENNGQVSGLLSDGLRFNDEAYLDNLLQTGLDHLMVVLRSEDGAAWSALDKVIAADLFVAVHLTLTQENSATLPDTLAKCCDRGIAAVSLSASQPSLSGQLADLRNLVAGCGAELVWDLPVPYSAINPIWLEVQEHDMSAVGKRAVLYLEPDGDVLPTQGDHRILGNALRDPWDYLWKQKIALNP